MASARVAPLSYARGPAVQSVQQPLAIPQYVHTADKRASQASACAGKSTSSNGNRKMQVGPSRLGRTFGRRGSDASAVLMSLISRSRTARKGHKYGTTCCAQNYIEIVYTDGEEGRFERESRESWRYGIVVQY